MNTRMSRKNSPSPRGERAAVRLIAITLATMVAGCAVGPDYERPAVELPANWEGAPTTGERKILDRWWTLYGDPVLDRLVEEALARNQDLAAAAADRVQHPGRAERAPAPEEGGVERADLGGDGAAEAAETGNGIGGHDIADFGQLIRRRSRRALLRRAPDRPISSCGGPGRSGRSADVTWARGRRSRRSRRGMLEDGE